MAINYRAPDVYIEEVSLGARPVEAVGTSTAGFIGVAPKGSAFPGEAVRVNSWADFVAKYTTASSSSTHLSHAVRGFFGNGGTVCYVVNMEGGTLEAALDALARIDDIAIVVTPGMTGASVYQAVLEHCETLQDRVAIFDVPERVDDLTLLEKVASDDSGTDGLRPPQTDRGFATVYYPWIRVIDSLNTRARTFVNVPPSGHMAGIWARTDGMRGVHKAPANESVRLAVDVSHRLTRSEHGDLNFNGVNVIRYYANEGVRVMGARTLADSASEYRYLNVRRLISMVQESIEESMRWVLFEPNDRPLWKSIRRDITAFLIRLWRAGALMGATADAAFYVKCDEETNPQENIDLGIVTTEIGLAPVKPAEFVVFRISQFVGGQESEEAPNA
jgi:hypothetical protein